MPSESCGGCVGTGHGDVGRRWQASPRPLPGLSPHWTPGDAAAVCTSACKTRTCVGFVRSHTHLRSLRICSVMTEALALSMYADLSTADIPAKRCELCAVAGWVVRGRCASPVNPLAGHGVDRRCGRYGTQKRGLEACVSGPLSSPRERASVLDVRNANGKRLMVLPEGSSSCRCARQGSLCAFERRP